MIIPINDRYRIKGDKYQYMVQRYKVRKDDDGNPVEGWESFQYFTTLESACQWLVEMRWRTAETRTLTEALAEKDRLIAELVHALPPKFEIIER